MPSDRIQCVTSRKVLQHPLPILIIYFSLFNMKDCYQVIIAGAKHDEEGRCDAGGHPKSTLIRTETTL